MKKRDFCILKETILSENVLAMSELIAIMEIHFQIGYVGSHAQKMHANLFVDIINKKSRK